VAKRKRDDKESEPAPVAKTKKSPATGKEKGAGKEMGAEKGKGSGKGKGRNAPMERSSSGGPLPTDYGSNEEDELEEYST
jgi:hypothetical protein